MIPHEWPVGGMWKDRAAVVPPSLANIGRESHDTRDACCACREANEPDAQCAITYLELRDRICQCANALKALGVCKVALYAPAFPYAAHLTVACLRGGCERGVGR